MILTVHMPDEQQCQILTETDILLMEGIHLDRKMLFWRENQNIPKNIDKEMLNNVKSGQNLDFPAQSVFSNSLWNISNLPLRFRSNTLSMLFPYMHVGPVNEELLQP